MDINDDTVMTCHAARKMLRLYEAYRATLRAQIAAMQQMQRHIKAGDSAQQQINLADVKRQEMLAWHTDAVFAKRHEQVRRRLYELQELPELS